MPTPGIWQVWLCLSQPCSNPKSADIGWPVWPHPASLFGLASVEEVENLGD